MIKGQVITAAILAAIASPAMAPAPTPQAWLLIHEDAAGDASIEDHGLSLGDCYDALLMRSGPGWACERGES